MQLMLTLSFSTLALGRLFMIEFVGGRIKTKYDLFVLDIRSCMVYN
jgi:hypothetical protein